MPTLTFSKIHPDAKLPAFAHPTDSGMDICTIESFTLGHEGSHYTFRTGLVAQIPEGYELQVRPRSGLAAREGVFAIFGTVDEGYRGEIRVTLVNLGHHYYEVHKGDRIAQLVLAPIVRPTILEVPTIDTQTDRGTDGFGSTGIASC